MSKIANLPKRPDGEIDKEAVCELFMKSPFIDWVRFAEAQGYDSHYSRREFPVKTWQEEKKRIIAEREADELSAIIFSRRFQWHKDTIRTLEDFPKASDTMMFLLKAKMQEWSIQYKEMAESRKRGEPIPKKGYAFNNISPMDMRLMAAAVKDVTETKYRSLLLNTWNVEKAESAAAIGDLDPEQGDKGFTIRVMGGKDMTVEEIQKMMDEYIDQPAEDVIDLPQLEEGKNG